MNKWRQSVEYLAKEERSKKAPFSPPEKEANSQWRIFFFLEGLEYLFINSEDRYRIKEKKNLREKGN